jgi:hypothetical protein
MFIIPSFFDFEIVQILLRIRNNQSNLSDLSPTKKREKVKNKNKILSLIKIKKI